MERLNRNLDGIYIRIQRDGAWCNVCMSDMTEDELRPILRNASKEWLEGAVMFLAKTVRGIGDKFDIVCE